jgi:hypothetical protein
MIKKDLIEELQGLAELSHADAEVAHEKADQKLLEWINDDEVSAAFRAIEKR